MWNLFFPLYMPEINLKFSFSGFQYKKVLTYSEAVMPFKNTHCNEDSPRRFNCNLCPYSTNTKTHMKDHSLVHTGERPFKCEVCNKAFTQMHTLKSHILIHTGEKPYTCDVCNTSFRHAHHLRKHKHKHL